MGDQDQEPFNRNEFIYRVGTFFLVIATGLLIFFLFSESKNAPQIDLFCWSTVLYVVGFMFRAQYKKAVKPSGRFRIFKKGKKEKEES
jgi:predicted membrane channel-forming protein YqfA (hemolysin III family)